MIENSTVNSIIEVLEDKKACEVNVINVDEKTSLAEYFIICHATSVAHSSTLVSSLEKAAKDGSVQLLRSDRSASKEWKVLDYGDVIVHIFLEESRYYYDLEKIWMSDDPVLELQSRIDLKDEPKSIDVRSLFKKAMGKGFKKVGTSGKYR